MRDKRIAPSRPVADDVPDEELAAIEAPLPEWERLRVQRFYAEMIEQELGPDLPEDVPARRTASGAVLWLVPGEAGRRGDEFAGGEAA